MIKIFSFLFIFMSTLVFSILCHGKDFSPHKAYLGIVGPGSGLGSFGHAFVSFSEENSSLFFEHETFSYLLKNIDNDSTILDFINHYRNSTLDFSIEKQEIYSQIQHYSQIEERTVKLLELNLTQAQVFKFYELIRLDYNNGKDSFTSSDYGILQNCITRPIQLLNKVLEPKNRIPLFELEDPSLLPIEIGNRIINPSKLFSYLKKGHLSHFPFAVLDILQYHPINKGFAYVFESNEVEEKKLYKRLFDNIENMQIKCEINKNIIDLIKIKSAKIIRDGELKGFHPIYKYLKQKCPSKKYLKKHLSYLKKFVVPLKDLNLYKDLDALYRELLL